MAGINVGIEPQIRARSSVFFGLEFFGRDETPLPQGCEALDCGRGIRSRRRAVVPDTRQRVEVLLVVEDRTLERHGAVDPVEAVQADITARDDVDVAIAQHSANDGLPDHEIVDLVEVRVADVLVQNPLDLDHAARRHDELAVRPLQQVAAQHGKRQGNRHGRHDRHNRTPTRIHPGTYAGQQDQQDQEETVGDQGSEKRDPVLPRDKLNGLARRHQVAEVAHAGPRIVGDVGGATPWDEPRHRHAQSLAGHVGVDLGRGDVRVPEQLLHLSQAGASVEQVSREAVAQRMRRHLRRDARLLDVVLDDQPQPLARQSVPARVEEERLLGPVLQVRHAALVEVRAQRLDGARVHGDDAFLRALAEAPRRG